MASPTLGVDPTATGTTLSAIGGHALGAVVYAGAGDKAYMAIQADEELTQYTCVVILSDFGAVEADDAATVGSADGQGRPLGVVPVTIASGSYGWAQVYGDGTVLAENSVSAGVLLEGGANGIVGAATGSSGSEELEGIVLTADSTGAGAATACRLNWPRVGATQ